MSAPVEVRAAAPADDADVVRVLATAFDDDPVTRWLLPSGSLAPLFRAHVRAANRSQQHLDLALLDGVAVGAAIWHEPAYHLSTWRQLAAIPRYAVALGRNLGRGATLESLMHQARPPGPLWYLAGIGAVRRGEGIGSALLEHRLADATGTAYLESSKWENVALYERFGFQLRESLHVPEGPELWPMLRPERGTSGGTPPG
jgi:GNAT superfamily N-acetyltransferase